MSSPHWHILPKPLSLKTPLPHLGGFRLGEEGLGNGSVRNFKLTREDTKNYKDLKRGKWIFIRLEGAIFWVAGSFCDMVILLIYVSFSREGFFSLAGFFYLPTTGNLEIHARKCQFCFKNSHEWHHIDQAEISYLTEEDESQNDCLHKSRGFLWIPEAETAIV